MIRTLFFLSWLWCMVVACESREKIKYNLNDDQLVNLLIDMHLADVILNQFPNHQQDSVRNIYVLRLSETYGMSEDEIQSEIDKLESEPVKMKLILGRVKTVVDSINK